MSSLLDKTIAAFGKTNDGEMIFPNSEAAFRNTAILNLIDRFKVILEIISNGHMINANKFMHIKLYIRQMVGMLQQIVMNGVTLI